MKVKQLHRLAKLADKSNAIKEAINDLESALKLINSDKKTNITIAVSNFVNIKNYLSMAQELNFRTVKNVPA